MSANHHTSLANRRLQLTALVKQHKHKLSEATSASSKAVRTAIFLTEDLHNFGYWISIVRATLSHAFLKKNLCDSLDILQHKCSDIIVNSANLKTQDYHERIVAELEQGRPPYPIGVAWQEWYDPIDEGSKKPGETVLMELLHWHRERLIEIWSHTHELQMVNGRLEKDWALLNEALELFGKGLGEPGKFKVEIIQDDDTVGAVVVAVGIILDKIGRK